MEILTFLLLASEVIHYTSQHIFPVYNRNSSKWNGNVYVKAPAPRLGYVAPKYRHHWWVSELTILHEGELDELPSHYFITNEISLFILSNRQDIHIVKKNNPQIQIVDKGYAMKNVYLPVPPISLSRGNPEGQFLGYFPREFYTFANMCISFLKI